MISDFRAVCLLNAVIFTTVYGARSMFLPLIGRESLHLSSSSIGGSCAEGHRVQVSNSTTSHCTLRARQEAYRSSRSHGIAFEAFLGLAVLFQAVLPLHQMYALREQGRNHGDYLIGNFFSNRGRIGGSARTNQGRVSVNVQI